MSWWMWLIVGIVVGVVGFWALLIYLGSHLPPEGARQREWGE